MRPQARPTRRKPRIVRRREGEDWGEGDGGGVSIGGFGGEAGEGGGEWWEGRYKA